ncbi:MAG: histidinol dehydrogenase, partial [Rickettsiales bacterium]
MPHELNTADARFEAAFQRLLNTKRDSEADVDDIAATIIKDVRARGDAAVLELTYRFDRVSLTPQTMRLGADAIVEARGRCEPETLEALSVAARRIEAFHQAQMPGDLD